MNEVPDFCTGMFHHKGYKVSRRIFFDLRSLAPGQVCVPSWLNPFGFGLPKLGTVYNEAHHLRLARVVVTGEADVIVGVSFFAGIDLSYDFIDRAHVEER